MLQITSPRIPATTSKQYAALAKSLRDLRRAIKNLPLAYQEPLPHTALFNWPKRPAGIEGLKRYLNEFYSEFDYMATWADEWSKRFKLSHADRRRDYQKLSAAQDAEQLLLEHGKKVSLTPGSAFLELANTLYEAATGKVDIDLRWQCRTVIEDQKRK